jgi:hypothetical protein
MADPEKTPSTHEDNNNEPPVPAVSDKKEGLAIKEDDLNSEHHVTGWKLAIIMVCLLMAMFLVALV